MRNVNYVMDWSAWLLPPVNINNTFNGLLQYYFIETVPGVYYKTR